MNTSGRAATLDEAKHNSCRTAEVLAAAEEGPLSRVSYLNGSVLRLGNGRPPMCNTTAAKPKAIDTTAQTASNVHMLTNHRKYLLCASPSRGRTPRPDVRPPGRDLPPAPDEAGADDRSRNNTNSWL